MCKVSPKQNGRFTSYIFKKIEHRVEYFRETLFWSYVSLYIYKVLNEAKEQRHCVYLFVGFIDSSESSVWHLWLLLCLVYVLFWLFVLVLVLWGENTPEVPKDKEPLAIQASTSEYGRRKG